MTNFLKSSIQTELDSFFQLVQRTSTPLRKVTKAAYTKARAKLDYHAFLELNQHIIQFFYSHFLLRIWHGFRLLAIDGTMLTLPNNEEMIEHFDQLPTYSHHKRPQARASHLYDILNRMTLHASLAPRQTAERELVLLHSPCLSHHDLVLLDRGYPAFWIFSWLLFHSTHFCVRVSHQSWKHVKTFSQSELNEQIITIQPTDDSRKKCRQHDLSVTPIRVRLIRVSIENGEDYVLMTIMNPVFRTTHRERI